MGKEEDDGVRRNKPVGVRAKHAAKPAPASGTHIVYDSEQCAGPLRKNDFGHPKAVLVSNIERKGNNLRSRKPMSDVTVITNTRIPKQRNAFDEDQKIAAEAQAMQKATFRF